MMDDDLLEPFAFSVRILDAKQETMGHKTSNNAPSNIWQIQSTMTRC